MTSEGSARKPNVPTIPGAAIMTIESKDRLSRLTEADGSDAA